MPILTHYCFCICWKSLKPAKRCFLPMNRTKNNRDDFCFSPFVSFNSLLHLNVITITGKCLYCLVMTNIAILRVQCKFLHGLSLASVTDGKQPYSLLSSCKKVTCTLTRDRDLMPSRQKRYCYPFACKRVSVSRGLQVRKPFLNRLHFVHR